MSSYNVTAEKDSVESEDRQRTPEGGPDLRPTVKLETQAKVDSEAIEKVAMTDERDHPHGMTLVAEEKWEAREAEKARTRERRQTQSTVRERGSRASVARGRKQARTRFDERAASVDPAPDPHRGDPRAELECDELAAVNQQAERISRDVREGGSRAAVSRQLGERVASGDSVLSASVAVMEAERKRPGTVVPIGELEDVSRAEVSVEGTVEVLWQPSHPSIAQVGLIEDETGRTKWTSWKRSRVPRVSEGERVRFRAVAKNWYDGRCSIALTGDSHVVRL